MLRVWHSIRKRHVGFKDTYGAKGYGDGRTFHIDRLVALAWITTSVMLQPPAKEFRTEFEIERGRVTSHHTRNPATDIRGEDKDRNDHPPLLILWQPVE